jgi:myosin heavy subunit
MEDMTTLLHLSEAALLRNLSYRFGGAAAGLPDGPNFHLIYTYVGNILIAVNPFKRGLAIYRPAMMNNYRKCVKNEVGAPRTRALSAEHVFHNRRM